jgi:RNA polymerase sigma-70 factor (ECF subfamily)
MLTVSAPDVTNAHSTHEFEAIFREHSRLVYRTAYGVTGNAEDAEDVLQTIFLRLVRRELPPNLKANPRAYLYRAAVNVSLTTLRSRRRLTLTSDPAAFENSIPAASEHAPDEVRDRLLGALEEMAQTDSAAVEMLILRYFHNYSDADIAKMFGKTRGAIALRLLRARARLKKMLGRSGGDKL